MTHITKIEDYKLFAGNGRYIRKATKVVFSDGQEVAFMDKMPKREAAKQAVGVLVNKLEKAIAVASMNGDTAAEQKFTKALELAVNSTDFPKVSA